ncbi:MAG: polysaccharide deacetylase family protein [Chryseolinea sp.]
MTPLNQIKKNATQVSVLSMIMLASVLLALPVLAQSDKTKKESKTWAEKLDFPKGKKVLLLHMDDIGMCPEANTAAIRYIENKNIMSAAVMMPCPNAEEFIKWAKNHPAPDIGLHLTLTSEWQKYRWPSVTDAAKVPGLIDPDGKLWHEVPDVVVHASAQEVETEIRAQIEKCIALGYRPTHIDTHMGTLYGSLEYTKAFFKVAQEYNIPANAIDMSDPDVVSQFTRQGYPFNDETARTLDKYLLPKLDNFTSVGPGPTYEQKRDNFLALIKSLKPGLTEIIFHPSVQTENLKSITGSWQQRVWEAELFSDPIVTEFFQKEGIIITNWKEIMKRFGKKSKK